MFDVYTNNAILIDKFIQDEKVLRLLERYINVDSHGYRSLPFRIQDGVIMLEFQNRTEFKPNLIGLRNNLHSIEDRLDEVTLLYNSIKQFIA